MDKNKTIYKLIGKEFEIKTSNIEKILLEGDYHAIPAIMLGMRVLPQQEQDDIFEIVSNWVAHEVRRGRFTKQVDVDSRMLNEEGEQFQAMLDRLDQDGLRNPRPRINAKMESGWKGDDYVFSHIPPARDLGEKFHIKGVHLTSSNMKMNRHVIASIKPWLAQGDFIHPSQPDVDIVKDIAASSLDLDGDMSTSKGIARKHLSAVQPRTVMRATLYTIQGEGAYMKFTFGEEKITLSKDTIATILKKGGAPAAQAITGERHKFTREDWEQYNDAILTWINKDRDVSVAPAPYDLNFYGIGYGSQFDEFGDPASESYRTLTWTDRTKRDACRVPLENRTMIVTEDRDEHRRKLDEIVERMNIQNPPRSLQPPIFKLDIGNGDKPLRHFGVLSSVSQNHAANMQGLSRLKRPLTYEERLNNKRKGTRKKLLAATISPIKAYGEIESRYSNPYRYITKYFNGQMKISASPGGSVFEPNNYHGVTMVRIKHRKQTGGSMRKKAKFRSLTSNTSWMGNLFSFRDTVQSILDQPSQ